MNKLVLLSEKKMHEEIFLNLKVLFPYYDWILINSKADFNLLLLQELDPEKIFIPHWSYIIPEEIYSRFECIVFHMTDLPMGRGGSPLQNLIVRGFKETKISALRVEKGIDAGSIYIKSPLMLYGTAEEIFLNAASIIQEMIAKIIIDNPKPTPQVGDVTNFRRRRPEDGDIKKLKSIEQIYDYIRMLDAENYPKAYVDIGDFRLEFSRVKKESHQTLLADVRIIKK